MSAATQQYRQCELISPLGKDVLLFHRMTGYERLGRLFEYHVEVLSADHDVNFADILGQGVAIRLSLPLSDSERFFHGHVSDFAQVDSSSLRYSSYTLTLRPWLWFLTRTYDCRIFQHQNVTDIVQAVFSELGFTDVESRLTKSYREREYCVQYRESDFDFVSRLLEEEGIYYYFMHEEDKHVLVLADDTNTLDALGKIPYFPKGNVDLREKECIFDWQQRQHLQPVRYVSTDFDFKIPKKSLLSPSAQNRSHARAEYEVFDYPGEFKEPDDGEHYSRVRIEELQTHHDITEGQTNVRELNTGLLFDLADYPRGDQNKTYAVIRTEHDVRSNEYETAPEDTEIVYRCRFSAIDVQQPFRPERTTPRPVVRGPQTAIVVGPAGDEIYTDEYGRVKCQFHWDRYGGQDENSSCWIRVAHPWAGKNWGAVAIPRIGQEVIVDFLEGDPDQPIITGRVYNGDQMPPYDLPANKTQTGIKSRSSLGGGSSNFNEIRFEDKKGDEQLFIHAEKNQDIEVENDETHWVGNDRTKTIDNDETSHIKHDRTETVDNNETITIGANRSEKVGVNETVAIGKDRNETVGANESIQVAANRSRSVGKNETVSVGSDESTRIGANRSLNVGGNESTQIGKDCSRQIGKNETASIGANRTHRVGKNDTLQVGNKLSINAGDEISIVTGSASIVMRKDGTIVIKGKDITIQGSGGVNVKASKNVVIKGQKILEN